MPFVGWNDRLIIGIADIDADHKREIQVINDLYDRIRAGSSRAALDDTLERLVAYFEVHFEREERLLRETQYPGTAPHAKEHDDMRIWILDMQARHQSGLVVAPSLEVMTRLKDWLFDHIMGSDQRYVPFLKTKGVL